MTHSTSTATSTTFSPATLSPQSLPTRTEPASSATQPPPDSDKMQLEPGAHLQGLPMGQSPAQAHEVLQARLLSLAHLPGSEEMVTELIRRQPDGKIDTPPLEVLGTPAKPLPDDKQTMASPPPEPALEWSDRLRLVDASEGSRPATLQDFNRPVLIRTSQEWRLFMARDISVIPHPGGHGQVIRMLSNQINDEWSAAIAIPPELWRRGTERVPHYLDLARIHCQPDGRLVCREVRAERSHDENLGRLSLAALSRLPYATPLNLGGETVCLVPPQPDRWPGMVEVFTLNENAKVQEMLPAACWKHPDGVGWTWLFEHKSTPLYYGRPEKGSLTTNDLDHLRPKDLLSINGQKVRLDGVQGFELQVTSLGEGARSFQVSWGPQVDIRCIGPGPLTWDRFAGLKPGMQLEWVKDDGSVTECVFLRGTWAAGQAPDPFDEPVDYVAQHSDEILVVVAPEVMAEPGDRRYDFEKTVGGGTGAVAEVPLGELRLPAAGTGALQDTKRAVAAEKPGTPPVP
ncbi:MAG: hypothetical protein V4757_03990 [Pseudomonadota bacterium]